MNEIARKQSFIFGKFLLDSGFSKSQILNPESLELRILFSDSKKLARTTRLFQEKNSEEKK